MTRKSPRTLITTAALTMAVSLAGTAAFAAPAKKKAAKAAPAVAATTAAVVAYASRDDAMQLAADIAARRDLPADWVRAQISEARNLPVVTKLMTPAGKTFVKNWTVYRSRFIDPVRIRAGVQFWQANRRALERAEQQFGVPAEIIVGIIGVETIYGRNMGNFRVMDALATLTLDFPQSHPRAQARTDYFRGELEQVLVTANRTGSDPFALRGSYAGAMGLGQFMPTSWDKFAIDFDGDGRIDLFNSATDAIGSVANYFVGYGWKPGLPTVFPVDMRAEGQNLAALLAPDINPTFTATQMAERGVRVMGAEGYDRPLALIELKNGSSGPTEYIAGTENFYAVTRYNWSAFYALSVIQLGREVHEAYLSSQTAARN
ncbi:lytic murein transglycosylase B [Comamonas testosteroni]|uniref:Lytic murein transglycosylase B n=1 Tax=Comamonas testosteroni TaxID=285 RepID=A0A373F968_COMTE|nr:lytic murein transglycosylase B [Comamonas testosteroni]RGE39969.1 lytic murein transglycosylase B [Comamonas testosteroni]